MKSLICVEMYAVQLLGSYGAVARIEIPLSSSAKVENRGDAAGLKCQGEPWADLSRNLPPNAYRPRPRREA